MIKIYNLRKQKLNENLELKNLKNTDIALIDCFNPTKKEIHDLSTKFSISTSDIKTALDNESRPRLMDYDDYSMIILSSALSEKSKRITTSFGIFFSDNKLIIIRKDKLESIKKFDNLDDNKKIMELSKGNGYISYLILEFTFDNYFQIMDSLEEEVNKLETKVFKSPDESIVRKIFRIKKDLIYIHKALVANREVISGIEKGYLLRINKKDLSKFKYVYHDATELLDIGGTYKDILTGTLEIYMSSVSNRLNVVMKKMTAMASFVLIPTLISGIYGMNFSFMPEFDWPHGYIFALGLMALSVVILYAYFKEKKYI